MIAQGVREANERLDGDGGDGDERRRAGEGEALATADGRWSAICTSSSCISIARAKRGARCRCWRSPRRAALVSPTRRQAGIGALRRPLDSGYRGADYDFITAVDREDDATATPSIEYTLDTKRARSEVRAQKTQRNLLLEPRDRARRTTLNADPQIGRTLFQLLVPVEMEPYLGGTTELHDRARQRHRRHSVGAARHADSRGRRRHAAVGDPLEAAAQAAH